MKGDDFFDFLIDLALKMGDHDWVKELQQKRDELTAESIKKEKDAEMSEEEQAIHDVMMALDQRYKEGYMLGLYSGFYHGCQYQYKVMNDLIKALNKQNKKGE